MLVLVNEMAGVGESKMMVRKLGTFAATVAMSFATALAAVGDLHPTFSIKHILPASLNRITGIGGIDLLPNGDGVICTWGGSQKTIGEVWIIPGLASGTPGTPTSIATGLREPLGVKVVGNDFYVMEKPRILKFTGSGTTWTKSTLWSLSNDWYTDSQWHHFSFNLVYKDNAFWFTTGTAYDYTPNDPLQRGALIRVPLAGGEFKQMARGLRNTNGIGIGPDNEFFVTDNQGHWKPTNVMYHIPTTGTLPTNGRFYGFRTNGNNACKLTPPAVAGGSCPEDPEYPPAVWLPYSIGGSQFSNSPTRPILLKEGPYAGQMLSGDVNRGGTFRYFVEKVEGEYQGVVFPFMTAGSGGINFGINQFLYTPTGSLLVAGIGGGDVCGTAGSGNWNWNSTCRGLDLLTPTTTVPFDIQAIRSTPGGFDIEFTKPAGASAATAANYSVKTTVFTPVQTYGADASNSDNNITVAVSSATPSSDGKRVNVQLASVLTNRMYAITLNGITSATSEALHNNVGYYTLNKVAKAVAVQNGENVPGTVRALPTLSGMNLTLPFNQPYDLSLYAANGSMLRNLKGHSPQNVNLGSVKPGIYLLSGHVDGLAWQRKLFLK